MQPIANTLRNVSERHLIDVLLKCLHKTSQRHLLKTSSRRIFLNFKKKHFCFIYLFLEFLYLVRKLLFFITLSFTSVLRRSINVATITSCFWSHFPVSVHRKGTFNLVLFTNQEQLPVFLWQIRQGCGVIKFFVAGIKRGGYNVYMLRWYWKTILNLFYLNFYVAFLKTMSQR